jgi:hypothetical protein
MWRQGAEAWTEELADEHLFEIEAACDRLLDDPTLGRPRHEREFRDKYALWLQRKKLAATGIEFHSYG